MRSRATREDLSALHTDTLGGLVHRGPSLLRRLAVLSGQCVLAKPRQLDHRSDLGSAEAWSEHAVFGLLHDIAPVLHLARTERVPCFPRGVVIESREGTDRTRLEAGDRGAAVAVRTALAAAGDFTEAAPAVGPAIVSARTAAATPP